MMDGRIHLYPFEHVLAPRGPLQKESLSLHIANHLVGAYNEWTNSDYVDSEESLTVETVIAARARLELEFALKAFHNHVDGMVRVHPDWVETV